MTQVLSEIRRVLPEEAEVWHAEVAQIRENRSQVGRSHAEPLGESRRISYCSLCFISPKAKNPNFRRTLLVSRNGDDF
jgi:hypothetical protein